jgi:hypothetical protein
MAYYTVPFAPSGYQRPERYTNPYVGSLLELMQGQARAQAAADERRMALAGQLWQNIAQTGAGVAQAIAAAPERKRQQELQRVQYDQVMRQRDVQTAVDNMPTDLSQLTPYINQLKPYQATAVIAEARTRAAAQKQLRDQRLDELGLSAATAPTYAAFADARRRAGDLTDEQFTQGLLDRARQFEQPGAGDWAAADEAERQAVIAASPTMQQLRAKATFDAEAKAREPYTLNPGDRRIVPGAPGQPDRVIEGGGKPAEFGAPDIYEVGGTPRLLRPRNDGRMIDAETGAVVDGRIAKMDTRSLEARLAAATDPQEQQRILRLMTTQANATRGPQAPVQVADPTSPTGARWVYPSQAVGQPAPRTERPLTQGQYTAAGYASRMAQAEVILTPLEPKVATMGWLAQAFNEGINDSMLSRLQSNDYKSYAQAARNFINANLRRESGAVISPAEFQNAIAQYLPVPGDSPQVLAQKRANRELVQRNLQREAGEAYVPPIQLPAVGTEQ